VFLVHGDPEAATAFADRIRKELGLDVQLPTYQQQVVLQT
jgi:Zn-dependent metallo-hydrolase RNA specificity domain